MKRFIRSSATPVVVFFALLMLGSLLLGMMTTSSLQWEARSRQDVADSYEIHSGIQNLFSLIEEAETSQRGYLLTQRPEFLMRYKDSINKIEQVRRGIREDIYKQPKLREGFDHLQAMTDKRLENLALAVALNKRRGPAAAAGVIESGVGSAHMSDVRAQVDQLLQNGDAQLQLSSKKTATLRLHRQLLQLAVLLTTLGAIGAAFWRDSRLRAAQSKILIQYKEVAARQAAIFDAAMDTIITLNPQGGIEMINASGVRLFGYPAEDLMHRDISTVIVPCQQARDAFQRSETGENSLSDGITQELTARHASGRLVPVDVAVRPMTQSDGVHVVAVVRDISQRRRMEDLKDSFIATASHELRTPLTSIAGSLGLLRGGAGGRLPANAMRLVQIAEANGRRLVRLVNDILDIEKIQSGTPFNKAPLQVRTLVITACEAMSGLAAEHLVTLSPDGVDEALWIEADHDRMMQVISNLVSNAIKASSRDGVVRLAVQVNDSVCRILVIDQGAGVPAQFHDKIFERFAQADPADGRGVNGTGLGLSIVQAIVERHDGVVGFDSPPGEGASFFVELPLIPQPRMRKPKRALAVNDAPSQKLPYVLASQNANTSRLEEKI